LAKYPKSFFNGEKMNQKFNQDVMFTTVKRDGTAVAFDRSKISVAMAKAFADEMGVEMASSASIRDKVSKLTQDVVDAFLRRMPAGGSVLIEDIQDQVELALMRGGEHKVARSYVLFRERHAEKRAAQLAAQAAAASAIQIKDGDKIVAGTDEFLLSLIKPATDLFEGTDPMRIVKEVSRNLYNGVSMVEVRKAVLMSARTLIEQDPVYDNVTAQLLLAQIKVEVGSYNLADSINRGIAGGIINPELAKFDLAVLEGALKRERDQQFKYLGLQTLYDRYFIHVEDVRIELPQTFFMRVAMGLALNESNREQRAIEFYEVLSSFDFMASTPTLFNSGTKHSQLSSCYLSTVGDDLGDIYDALKDNALLSKYAGGLGNDWTPVRAMGARIKGTNGKSQGVVPFLKVVNDTAVAVNQGGKRKGAVCAYLETWHLDVEEFLDLRKNTGDDRRRTHDMNTANWIPDLFMKRVMEGGEWTLFSPNDVTDLHEIFGDAFEAAYVAYEAKADAGEILFKRVKAVDMWRKMLTMLFETGHPWVTFKDPCNIRSPQQHAGVVHSSNLCTEITLNTSKDEIAVCNLGSVNLANHVTVDAHGNMEVLHEKLERTVRTAMRMLDNVVDINFYAVDKARNSNLKHRPVGMGIMGFNDVLYIARQPYASQTAVQIAGRLMEEVAFYAYSASSDMAAERGVYSSYEGSLWSKGILPKDSLELLAKARKGYLELDVLPTQMDWDGLRAKILKQGMRNSNCLAIAPTATISNIIGVAQSIEPTYQNLFVKSNLSGEFTVINSYLVNDLKARGLWDDVMIADLKYFDGTLAKIDRIPEDLKQLYATAFEIEPKWLIEAAAQRQVHIDQAQSLNIYMSQPSGKKLDETYKLAWLRGLKTTYYLRSMGATSAEKSTSKAGALNSVQSGPVHLTEPEVMGKVCTLRPGDAGFEECESCQ